MNVFGPIGAQSLEELVGGKNVVISDFWFICQTLPVTLRPFAHRFRLATLVPSWIRANDGDAKRMTAIITCDTNNEHARFLS